MEKFGRYMQDANGEELSEISWLVLETKESDMLIVTEKIIDFLPLKTNCGLNPQYNDLSEWLNDTFFNLTFSEEEKNIIESNNGRKVFLLDIEDYERYHFILNNPKPELTDFAKTAASKNNKTKHEWWLQQPMNTCIEYGCIAREDGLWKLTDRLDESYGVRPAIWVVSG